MYSSHITYSLQPLAYSTCNSGLGKVLMLLVACCVSPVINTNRHSHRPHTTKSPIMHKTLVAKTNKSLKKRKKSQITKNQQTKKTFKMLKGNPILEMRSLTRNIQSTRKQVFAMALTHTQTPYKHCHLQIKSDNI